MILELIIGIGLTLTGIVLLIIDYFQCKKCTIPAKASIVSVKHKTTADEVGIHDFYRPIIKYVVQGKTYKSKAHISSSYRNRYKIGEKIEIRYNPEKPTFYMINGKGRYKAISFFILIIGIVLLICYFLI